MKKIKRTCKNCKYSNNIRMVEGAGSEISIFPKGEWCDIRNGYAIPCEHYRFQKLIVSTIPY